MKTRDAVIEYQKTLDDVGTLTKDLDLVDPVSALALEFQGTNGTTSNEDNFISDVITKVEIVDGSEVLYSLNLMQLEALHFYKLGRAPTLFPSEWASGSQRHMCLLLFGRRLWDPEFAMDFTRFKNPQLKITTNIAAIRAAAAAGAFVSGSLQGTIVAKVMEDVPAPGRYLMAKQIANWTSGTSGEKRIELPTDYPYRMLLTRFFLEGSDPDELISDIKLTGDMDKFVMLNRKLKQIDAEALAQFGDMWISHNIVRSSGGVVRGLMQKEVQFLFTPSTSTRFTEYIPTLQFSGNVTLEIQAGNAGGTADTRHWGREYGHALHATTPIAFGDMDRPETWFDPTPYNKFESVLTEDNAGVCELALEQARPL
jgi:hypothetical protein